MTFHNPWHPSALPCASPRSEHGILGKRRVKLRSPAVGRTPRGCQPDEQFRPRLSGTLWSAAVRVRGSRAQRRGRSTPQLTSTACITPAYWPAFALRGRPLSAALSSSASAARVRWRRSTDCGCWSTPTHTCARYEVLPMWLEVHPDRTAPPPAIPSSRLAGSGDARCSPQSHRSTRSTSKRARTSGHVGNAPKQRTRHCCS